jgi:hypothetical protein
MGVPEWFEKTRLISQHFESVFSSAESVPAEIHHHVLRSTTMRTSGGAIVWASHPTHQMRRRRSKAPTKRTVAVNVITMFIDHLLGTRLRLSPVAGNTKFRTEQQDTLRIGWISSVIELLAHQQQRGDGASFS